MTLTQTTQNTDSMTISNPQCSDVGVLPTESPVCKRDGGISCKQLRISSRYHQYHRRRCSSSSSSISLLAMQLLTFVAIICLTNRLVIHAAGKLISCAIFVGTVLQTVLNTQLPTTCPDNNFTQARARVPVYYDYTRCDYAYMRAHNCLSSDEITLSNHGRNYFKSTRIYIINYIPAEIDRQRKERCGRKPCLS